VKGEKDPRQRDLDRQLSPWSRRRVLSWSLFGLAGFIVVQHLVAHAGWRPIPMGMGKQDIFFGYPMAIVLAIIGAFALDPRPRL
jgi:hypothetical protein